MDFKKKLKARLNIAIAYIVIGVALILLSNFGVLKNEFFSAYGIALIVMGFARVRQHRRITRNEETIEAVRIAETDERNISIMQRARGVTFVITVIAAVIAVIVFEILGKTELMKSMAAVVCGMTAIYWISYYIISRRN